MKWQITFTLTRDNDLKQDDESWFDRENIASEIQNWLADLDYELPDGIEIKSAE